MNVFPIIPPQFYRRYTDLSKYTLLARKEDIRLKTMITLGNEDLVLKTRLKNETDWEREKDLWCFGEIVDMDLKI